jgi:hypothetical protein
MDGHEAFKQMFEHDCGNKSIVSNDSQRKLLVGWKCEGCGRSWNLELFTVVKTRRFPQWAAEPMITSSGRTVLAEIFEGGVLVVQDEVAVE